MKMKSIVLVITILILLSCDPALRLKIVIDSNDTVSINKYELYPNGIIYDSEIDSSIVITLDDFHGTTHTEFYGIGGWRVNESDEMKSYLDSLFVTKLDVKFSSEVRLKEFGNSLMEYRILLNKDEQ